MYSRGTTTYFRIIHSLQQQRKVEEKSDCRCTSSQWRKSEVSFKRPSGVDVVRTQPWAGTPQGFMSKEMSDSDSSGPVWVKTVMPRQSPPAKLLWPEQTGRTSQTNSSPVAILGMMYRKEVSAGLINESLLFSKWTGSKCHAVICKCHSRWLWRWHLLFKGLAWHRQISKSSPALPVTQGWPKLEPFRTFEKVPDRNLPCLMDTFGLEKGTNHGTE